MKELGKPTMHLFFDQLWDQLWDQLRVQLYHPLIDQLSVPLGEVE